MQGEQDAIAFLRFVLRSGDIRLAERLAHSLRSDARYRERADAVLRALPPPAAPAHSTPGGLLLDSLAERFAPRRRN